MECKKAIPIRTISKSDLVASFTITEALNDKVKHTAPNVPGIPQPGLCNSNSIPKKPKVVNKEATTGFVKKRTKSNPKG